MYCKKKPCYTKIYLKLDVPQGESKPTKTLQNTKSIEMLHYNNLFTTTHNIRENISHNLFIRFYTLYYSIVCYISLIEGCALFVNQYLYNLYIL